MYYINHIPTIISKPGIYNFSHNLQFYPSSKKQSAIIIDSNNVVLDLNGFTLQHKNNIHQIIGIYVNSGHYNINIINGSITGFSQLGISIDGNNKNIKLNNLSIRNCGYGSTLAFKDDIDIIHQGGLKIGETYYFANQGFNKPLGIIENLTMNNLIVTNNCVGSWIGNGKNYEIVNCSFSENTDDRVLGGPVLGTFFPPNITKYVWGLNYFSDKRLGDTDVDHWIIKNCKFNKNGTTVGKNQSGVVTGCELTSLQKNVLIEDCEFNDNYGLSNDDNGYTYVHGFDAGGGQNIKFINCQFNKNIGNGNVQGCHISGTIPDKYPSKNYSYIHAKNINLIDCNASDNVCSNSSFITKSFGYGFDGNYILNIINCDATNNKNMNDDGQLAGLYITFDKPLKGQNINILIDGFNAYDNNSNCNDSSDILLNDNVHNITIINSSLNGYSTIKNEQTTNGVCIKHSKNNKANNIYIKNNLIEGHKNQISKHYI